MSDRVYQLCLWIGGFYIMLQTWEIKVLVDLRRDMDIMKRLCPKCDAPEVK